MKTYQKAIVKLPDTSCSVDVIEFDSTQLVPVSLASSFIQVRTSGNLSNKGFYLSTSHNWYLVKDDTGFVVLVPTIK